MTYLQAARHAKEAADLASTARSHYSEYEDKKLAEAVEELAKAVQELARAANNAD